MSVERQFLCSVLGAETDQETAVYATTRSKARYKFWLGVTDAWPELPITQIKVRIGAPPPPPTAEWKQLGISRRQRDMARHALGFDNSPNKTSNRNHYVICFGCDGYREWLDLSARDLAVGRTSDLYGGDDIFYCTRRLALAVREPDEHLSPEFYDPEYYLLSRDQGGNQPQQGDSST